MGWVVSCHKWYAMSFKVRIKNIGKLVDTEISIGEFTVFAGPNNTGKSFVSKLLYSFFDAMNANHAEIHISNLVGPVEEAIRRLLRQNITDDEDERLSLLNEEIEALRIIAKKIFYRRDARNCSESSRPNTASCWIAATRFYSATFGSSAKSRTFDPPSWTLSTRWWMT